MGFGIGNVNPAEIGLQYQVRYPKVDSLLYLSFVADVRYLYSNNSSSLTGFDDFEGQYCMVKYNAPYFHRWYSHLGGRADFQLRNFILGTEISLRTGIELFGSAQRQFYAVDSSGVVDSSYVYGVDSGKDVEVQPILLPPFYSRMGGFGVAFVVGYNWRKITLELKAYPLGKAAVNLSYQLTTKPLRKKRTKYRIEKL